MEQSTFAPPVRTPQCILYAKLMCALRSTLWTPPQSKWVAAGHEYPPEEPTIHPLRNLLQLAGYKESSSLVERVVLGLCAVDRVDPSGSGQNALLQPNSDIHTPRLLRALGWLHLDRLELFYQYRAVVSEMQSLKDDAERTYLTQEYQIKLAHLCFEHTQLLPMQGSAKTLSIAIAENLLKVVRMQTGLDDGQDEMEATRDILKRYFEWHEFSQGEWHC
jgi:hypothetical protein